MRSQDLGLIAMFAALTCVLGLAPVILLPLVGITFAVQTLGMLLAGGVIGAKRGALSMGLVIVLVAIGLPVLTGAQGGLHKLIGLTGGFIWSWPLGAFLVGVLIERWWSKLTHMKAFFACLVGSVSLYLLGHTWLAIYTQLPLHTALWSWVLYLPGDIAKSVVAAIVIMTVKRAYPLINPTRTPS
ncbi:MAG: biotin transporter BioY [Propionibacteriaceae bacterium]|jgi:biotin transport system substrate-specific component|nr:biotin transporter BioY [Propionibacteriaceae bacterium]